jgi:hypothetical protein
VARAFAFQEIISAPRSNTTPVHPLLVMILNSAPSLTIFKGGALTKAQIIEGPVGAAPLAVILSEAKNLSVILRLA